MDLNKRFLKPSENSFFLFGARGTGKSTWVQQTFPDALVIDLLDPETERALAAFPERLIEKVNESAKHSIIIDEVQKMPRLLDVVHLLIERNKNLQFILTGSSIRKLKQQGVNLLGGRASLKYMYPYMAAEIKDHFSLEKALKIGLLPLILDAKNPEQALEGYINLYLNPEIRMEGYVHKIEDFARFLEVMTFSHGSVINITNIARDASVKRTTTEGYLNVIEDLLIGFRIHVFTKAAQRALTAHPKFYFFDTGLYRFIRPRGFREVEEEILGHAIEGLVAQHLRAWCDYSIGRHRLFYWRTAAKQEVDFVIHGDSGLYAFEVKNSKTIRPSDLTSMKLFREDYPSAKCFFLYRGDVIKEVNGFQCIPLEYFLKNLVPLEDLTSPVFSF